MIRAVSKFIPKSVRFNHTATVGPFTQIEARWTKLPAAEQGALADKLTELQKGDWKKMTLEEKRAAYYIAYGAHGSRAPPDPTLNYRVLGWVAAFMAVAGYLFVKTQSWKPKLRTDTPEWREAEAALKIERQQNPFQGPFAEHLKSQNK